MRDFCIFFCKGICSRVYVCSGKLLGWVNAWVNAWVTEEFGQKLGAITACFVNCFEYSRIPLLQKLD